ncbi:hypothetical protein TCDM_12850 [Trypanosoma cruzi Dm28c]|uniref:Uncharacterized protein n=1 Tax=Trypanosoma cruzi Dm28c TaxID=1416333 RepID=V5AK88_TRYCR|nr:hypothetical protein TCDM_12850 [Trypanosoma cruzi Dm28c]
MRGLPNHRNARPKTSGMCRHIADKRAHSAADWAGECQSAARWQEKSCGVFVGKMFRRRQRRASLLSKERDGTTDTEGYLWSAGCAGLSKSGQELHRACAEIRHFGHDVRVNTRNRVLATPSSACHAVCAPSFSSWNFFQYGRLTAVRRPTCQALTQSCERDRAIVASASAVTLRGAPQCHGENVESTVRPQSTSESGTVQISSVTPSCAASGPRRSASIAERESVAAGTRVGDRDAAARRGTENCLWPRSVAGQSARQKHARLPAAAR